ncbi:hypothetical protein L1049_017090 [Liquidambar formosana]|uniref:Transposase n=1 Tax=Liquidambar formosana TaxID=63359 RepID=A0AAP0S0I2_LIQFO
MQREHKIDETNDSKARDDSCSRETDGDDGNSFNDDGNSFGDECTPQAAKKLVHILNPQFELGMDTTEANCLEVYEEEREKIKEVLRNFDGQISLPVDILRYEKRYGGGYDYLCLRAHFIHDSWDVKNWVLNFRRIWYPLEVVPHEAILESLKDWDIENKISTLTMVNSEYYDETVEFVKDHIQSKKEFQLNGQLFRVFCCGDFISLMVQDAFDEISEIIDTVSQLYSFGRSLPLWYLTSSKLKDALELESMGEFSSKEVTDHYEVPSADEWDKVRSICRLVDSIYKVADALFQTKHVTSSIFHHLHELQAILTRESSNSDSFIRTVVKKMLQKFDKYWKDMFLVLTIATVMDPRSKMKFIEFSSSKFEGSNGNSRVRDVLEAIHSIYDDYVTRFPGKENFVCDMTSSNPEEDSPSRAEEGGPNSTNALSDLQEYLQFIQSISQPPKSELDWYLGEPVLPWSQDFNALSWWRAASPKYPTLSKMARDFLAIPISLATSFDAFYTEQREADKRVISLRPALMNALMCTRSWNPEK